MKIPLLQLEQTLRTSLAPLYLICGDEPLLVEEGRLAIIKEAMNKGFAAHEILHVESAASFDWQDFMGLAYNVPFDKGKQIIELRLGEIKLKDSSATSKNKDKADGSSALITYANRPPKNKILIISAPKLDSASQKTKWVSAINRHGVIIEIWPLVGAQVIGWITRKLHDARLNTSRDGIELIATFTAGNLLATKQEIEKLALLYNCETKAEAEAGAASAPTPATIKNLSPQQILTSLTNSAKFNLFDLVDAIYAQNLDKTKTILLHLQQEGAEPTFILWVLTREIRMLINLKDILERHGSAALNRALTDRTYKIKSTSKIGIQRILERTNINWLAQALQHAAVIDRIIKGVANVGDSAACTNKTAHSDDAWLELQRLAMFFFDTH